MLTVQIQIKLIYHNFSFYFKSFSDLLLVVIISLISTWCLPTSAAGLRGVFGADGMWGEQNNQPLQTNTNAYCCIRRPLSLRGMVHSSWSRHQQAGQLGDTVEYSSQQFCENVNLSNFAVQPNHEVFVQKTCFVFIQDLLGEAPIHKAARSGSLDCMQALLLAGAKPK